MKSYQKNKSQQPKLFKNESIGSSEDSNSDESQLDFSLNADGDLDLSVVLDDVMQYFDFLDEADKSSTDLTAKTHVVTASAIKEIDISNLPIDFNHFLIRHFSHCIQLLDELKFLNKKQSSTSFKLNKFESLLFEKIQAETRILRYFLSTLINSKQPTDTSAKTIDQFNPIIIEILNESLSPGATETGSNIWLKSININENQNDKCILNAEKSSLLINIIESFNPSDNNKNNLFINQLVNKLTHNWSIGARPVNDDDELQHTSISVYHFCAIQNFIDLNKESCIQLDAALEILSTDLNRWYDSDSSLIYFKDLVFGEIILASLLRIIHSSDNDTNSQIVTEKFLQRLASVDAQKTADIVLNVTIDALLNLKNKSCQKKDTLILNFLVDRMMQIYQISSSLFDYTHIEFIKLQIANIETASDL